MFGKKTPAYVSGPVSSLKKGFNIKLKGSAQPVIEDVAVSTFAIQPTNFIGMSPIPKLMVELGDEVKAGDHLFFDKKRPEIKYVAPVSGEIAAINRGEKRSITEVMIIADKDQKYRELPSLDLSSSSREDIVNYLIDSGAWTLMRQRPFNLIADPKQIPTNIFISTFDTAPLAPDLNLVVQGQEDAFQEGVKVLSKLTNGDVWLGLNANGKEAPAQVFQEVEHAKKHWFMGPHPSGNVGIQIHHIKPISRKDVVWALDIQQVMTIGKLFIEKRYNAGRIIAVTGEVKKPVYIKTKQGAKISDILKGQEVDEIARIISGDVLSGQEQHMEGFLNYYDDQITVIPEGNEFELFGWLLPLKARPSVSKTYPNFLFPNREFTANTNPHGEGRAFVVTGQYEDLLPMDIYPQHLMKAILTQDYEKMEGLGIYELSEEDVALCEFACTSKQPLQEILREGLEYMREQG